MKILRDTFTKSSGRGVNISACGFILCEFMGLDFLIDLDSSAFY